MRGKQMVAHDQRPPVSFSSGMSSNAVGLAATVQRHLVESCDAELPPRCLEKTRGEQHGDLQQVAGFHCFKMTELSFLALL